MFSTLFCQGLQLSQHKLLMTVINTSSHYHRHYTVRRPKQGPILTDWTERRVGLLPAWP